MVETKTIVLFHPKTEAFDDWFRIPLPLLSICRLLDKNKYQIKIIDGMVDRDYENKILKYLKDDAICLSISSMTGYQIHDGLKVAKSVKKKFPSIPIIWGGWHPSILPKQTVQDPNVDIVVRGMGELTFPELISKLEKNLPLDNIQGITYKKNGKIVENPDRPLADLNRLPPLPYHLINVEKYVNNALGSRTINYVSSAGCPHRCTFCVNSVMFGRRWISLDAKKVLDELEGLVKKYDINGIIYEDSNFFVDKKRVKDICEGMIKRRLNIKWHADGRTEHLIKFEDSFWETMRKSGCVRILVGAESGSQKILDFINKDATVDDTIKFAKKCKKHRMGSFFSLMVGFPNQPEDEFFITMNLIKKLKSIDDKKFEILVFFYAPYPGTLLYKESIKCGFKEPKSLEEWSRFDLRLVHTPWVNKKKFENIISFYLPLAYPNFVDRLNPLLKGPFMLFHYLSYLRFKYNFFHFPIEWIIFNQIRKKRKIRWFIKPI